MRILQLVTRRQYRGAEVFAANLSTELIKLGHEIIFAGLYKNKKDILYVEDADNVDLVNDKKGSFSIEVLRGLIKIIKSSKPDVIQCNGSDTLKYMVVASYFFHPVPVVYRNISMISEWVSGGHKRFIYKNLFKRISHISSVGKEAIEDFITTFNYPRQKTSVIRRGIPLKEIDHARARIVLKQQFGLEEQDQIVMHIGNFSPEKNHIFLLEIFKRLKYKYPKFKLICVGDGILFNEIEMEIRNRDLENTVFLTGFRKDIPELLAAADCFVLPSKVEGVPGVILEAATQRKPSVATNVGGVNEVLINNKTGFIIDDFNEEKFRLKLIELLNDAPLRKRMGNDAYSLVLEEYNPVKNAKKFEELYISLIKKH